MATRARWRFGEARKVASAAHQIQVRMSVRCGSIVLLGLCRTALQAPLGGRHRGADLNGVGMGRDGNSRNTSGRMVQVKRPVARTQE